eukprot:scaffold22131_cov100-Isochrysis_galbana.AAC.4
MLRPTLGVGPRLPVSPPLLAMPSATLPLICQRDRQWWGTSGLPSFGVQVDAALSVRSVAAETMVRPCFDAESIRISSGCPSVSDSRRACAGLSKSSTDGWWRVATLRCA